VFSNTVVTVLLAEWDLTCNYFDADPNKAFKDIQRIHSRMAVSEHVSHEDTWDFVGSPRYTFD
jgi:hypothetical protein